MNEPSSEVPKDNVVHADFKNKKKINPSHHKKLSKTTIATTAAGVAAIVGGMFAAESLSNQHPQVLENPHSIQVNDLEQKSKYTHLDQIEPNGYYEGIVKIKITTKDGLNIRTSPNILGQDNLIDKKEIKAFNNVEYPQEGATYTIHNPAYKNGNQGRWIIGEITLNDGSIVTGYINNSQLTREYVDTSDVKQRIEFPPKVNEIDPTPLYSQASGHTEINK
jgi:hypothetical protein